MGKLVSGRMCLFVSFFLCVLGGEGGRDVFVCLFVCFYAFVGVGWEGEGRGRRVRVQECRMCKWVGCLLVCFYIYSLFLHLSLNVDILTKNVQMRQTHFQTV